MILFRRIFILWMLLFGSFSLAFQPARAQGEAPVALVMTSDGPIMPPMLEYIKRGVQLAERRKAEALVIQLNTPGGSIDTMLKIIDSIRAIDVPIGPLSPGCQPRAWRRRRVHVPPAARQ